MMAARTDLCASSLVLSFRLACATRWSCWCCRLEAAQSVLVLSLWPNVLLWSPTSDAWLPYRLTTSRSHTPLPTTAALLFKLQLLVRMPLVAQPAVMVRLRLAPLLVALVLAHLLPSLLVVWRAARVPLLPVPNRLVVPPQRQHYGKVLPLASVQRVLHPFVPRTLAVQLGLAAVLLVVPVQLVAPLIVSNTLAVQRVAAGVLLLASVQRMVPLVVPRTRAVQLAAVVVLWVVSMQLVAHVIVLRKPAAQLASVVVPRVVPRPRAVQLAAVVARWAKLLHLMIVLQTLAVLPAVAVALLVAAMQLVAQPIAPRMFAVQPAVDVVPPT